MIQLLRDFDFDSVVVRILSRIGFEEDGCWPWLHAVDKDGYGGISIDGRIWRANRAVWTFFFGPIPDGVLVCHQCDNPLCVRPSHLFLGSNIDNINDMDAKGRRDKFGMAKVTEDAVRAIRIDDRPRTIVAEAYGISPGTVTNIKKKHSWSHVT